MSLDIRPNPSASAGGITGGLVYKGSYNATTNTPDLTSSDKGDFYIVSVGGTLAGITLDVGDHIVFNQDAASPITSAMFDKIDNTDAVASVNGQTGPVVLDTDDISEEVGATNLYYTNARFDTQLATKDTDNLSEGTSNLYYTNARFDTQLGTKDTGDLSEGSNLYYTNARADARIGAANLTDLNDVNYTAGAGINGYVLEYVHANTRWEAKEASGGISSVNGDAGPVVVLDSDDVAEGTTNLYYTNARFDTQLATKDTDDVSEGTTNLYYTNARFDTQLATKDTGDLAEGSNLYYTNARADARIGAANLTDLNDVSYTAGAGINGYVLEYVHANTRWEAKEAASGGGGFSYTAITSASSPVTSAISTHYGADSSGGTIVFNLPALSGLTGGEEIRIKLNTAGNNLTLTPNGSDTIEGAASYVMSIAKESVTCVASSGTNWEII